MTRYAARARRLFSRWRRYWTMGRQELRFHWALVARNARLTLTRAGLPFRRQYLVLRCMDGRQATGLFSEFAVLLGSLEHFDRWKDAYAGLRVDFSARGLYYDSAVGPDWWEYYFQRIDIGSADGAILSEIRPPLYNRFADNGELLERGRGFELIDRYIRPQPRMREKVEAYVSENFGDGVVIGIHYRGTDKFQEAVRVPYEDVMAAIRKIADGAALDNYKLFVATDEQAFLDYMIKHYPDRILFRDVFRSTDGRPIDVVNAHGNHRKGEDAVLDCLLLSRCDFLVRTSSALSLCSTLINPDMPVTLLNRERAMSRPREWAYRGWNRLKRGIRLAFALLDRTRRYLLLVAGLPATKEFLVLRCRGDGLFSEFAAVLGTLRHYEKWKPIYAGLRVDFANRGLYRDPAHGDNWWEYYFERIDFGSDPQAVLMAVSDRQHDCFAAHGSNRLSRRQGHALIGRHVRPKARIRSTVEEFVRDHFRNSFVIGVHYRGTDKHEEAPRIPYDRVRAAVRDAMSRVQTANCKLFLATDEQAFLDYMLEAFPGILSFRRMHRSVDGQPIHERCLDNFEKGESAVIDCLLLSRADLLIRTASNLSLCSTMFNPDLPVVLLSHER